MQRTLTLIISLMCCLHLSANAAGRDDDAGGACSQTTAALYRACVFAASDDQSVATAVCINTTDPAKCAREARAARKDAYVGCDESRQSRKQICRAIGEAPSLPAFGPAFVANFVDPDLIGHGVAPNPYLPLVVGNTWKYEKHVVDDEGDAEIEHVTVTVTDQTKLINGIQCRVVTDVNFVDDELHESTVDWLAQDVHGNVWYCGENTAEYGVFDGDHPKDPELLRIDGSFKAGRDGAKAGILLPGAPVVGRTYREEVSWANAEDVSKVLSLTGTEHSPAASCTGNCLVISDFTPLNPGSFETKYFKPGVGQILTVADATGARSELVEVHLH